VTKTIHLGYEVGSGAAVEIPVKHTVVTGQTQESGKTTALEALISRSGLPAIAFLTKRGESGFSGRQILPYFRERADWQFVQSIIESAMRQGMDFKQPWIIRACEGARTLADVQDRAAILEGETRNSMSKDMYMTLGEYLKIVVPLIASLPRTDRVEIGRGLSIMDLGTYPEELQHLVIASTLEWIHKNSNGVITIIPEAWKFIPEGKNTPVKVVAEKLAREGAALKNYLWIDSQDIAGVAKLILRSCAVWLIGVQREANEVKRAIDNMPAGMKRPKPADVATLELGQFFVCHGRELSKAYVQPAWVAAEMARAIARGRAVVSQVQRRPDRDREEDAMYKEQAERLAGQVETLTEEIQGLRDEIARLQRQIFDSTAPPAEIARVAMTPAAREIPKGADPAAAPLMPPAEYLSLADRIREDVLAIIRKDPSLIRLAVEKPAIEVTVRQKVLSIDDSGVPGKIAKLMSEGFFGNPRTFEEVRAELVRRGVDKKTNSAVIGKPLYQFTKSGFFYRDGDKYFLAPDAVVTMVEA